MKYRVHFSSKDYALFDKNDALDSFAYFCYFKANIPYHITTIDELVGLTGISKATIYRHLKVIENLGYVKRSKKTLIFKGNLTKDTFKPTKFYLDKKPKRKNGQAIHMSVRIGSSIKDTKASIEGLKIISNVTRQKKAIETRGKAASRSKKTSKLTKRAHIGFTTLSNARAAKITNRKSKLTGQKKLRKLRDMGYFKMKAAYVEIPIAPHRDNVSMGHPAYRVIYTGKSTNVLVRQIGNQISEIAHLGMGDVEEGEFVNNQPSSVFVKLSSSKREDRHRIDTLHSFRCFN